MNAIALTDLNGLYGTINFYKKARELNIKPIIGVELPLSHSKKDNVVILAKDYYGYTQLCELITEFHLNKNFDLFSALKQLYENGICKDNDCHFIVLTNNINLAKISSSFLDNKHLYIELNLNIKKISSILNLAESINRKIVITGNVYFGKYEDYKIHRLLRAISELKTINSRTYNFIARPENHFQSIKELTELEAYCNSLLIPTVEIANMCDISLPIDGYKFPKFPAESTIESYTYLRKVCEMGAIERYKVSNYGQLSKPIKDRIEKELSVINRLGFTDYFLFVWDIVQYANKNNIPVIGRGSAANSIVSYLLGITNVDPLAYNLYFERFLNSERKSPPDVDIDFCWKRRDEVLNYVYKKYGMEKVGMISTHVKFMGRSLIREIGKAIGLPETYLNNITSRLPYFCNASQIIEATKNIPECRTLPIKEEPLKTILAYANRIDGFPRHLSIHPGGIVITPEQITNFVPLEQAKKGLAITQYDMFSIEDIGLIKIDLLSQRSLSVYADVLKTVQETYSKPLIDDLEKIYEDEETKKLIRNGKTIGCFYIESPAMRQLLKKLKVDNFLMLTAASSVIRPGVAESGMMQQYIRRHNKIEPVNYLHPKMETILKETYGVMIYQEDVLRVAHEIIGLSLQEADLLRRAMSGKKRSKKEMEKLRCKFISTAISNGINKAIAIEIWRQIESFAGYAFCKAHSASYAQLSFKVAYLKAHYPAEFMAAVLSNQGGFYHPSVYLSEARLMNLHILPVNINKSDYYYKAEIFFTNKNDAAKQICKNAIRVGFVQIKNISMNTINSILKEREKGIFRSIEDFLYRVNVPYSEAYILTRLGAMKFNSENLDEDKINNQLTTPQMLWKLKALYPVIQKLKSKKNHILLKNLPSLQEIPKIPEYSITEQIKIEEEYLGMAVTTHPLIPYLKQIKYHACISSSNFYKYIGKIIICVGWLTTLKRITTSKGKYMLFVGFEDLDGFFETTLFPDVYQKYGAVLIDRGPYLIQGKIIEDFGYISINVVFIKHM